MKPPPKPGEQADLVVYLDANMPELRPCGKGCQSRANYPCRHRFGERIWVISDQARISFAMLADLQVFLDFVYIIHRKWCDRKGCARKKRFVIMTHDKTFVAAAQSLSANARYKRLPVTFGADWIQYQHGKRAIRVEVHAFNLPHADRDRDIMHVVHAARAMRAGADPS
jgi:hypothetical protein